MLPVLDLVKLILEMLGFALFGWFRYPGMLYFPIMISVVLIIVLRQHVRQARLEEHLFGSPFTQPRRQVLTSLAFGVLGGFAASFLMVALGLPISEDLGLIYVWPVVLLLMMINPRFMCFAYGGGIVGVVTLLLRGLTRLIPGLGQVGFLAGLMSIDLAALMALVGLLHLTESFLIFVSGHLNASPVMVQNSRGEVVGGFMLQRFWPLPMTALLAQVVSQSQPMEGSIPMPDWWPLLSPLMEPGQGMILMFSLLPIVAALGYSDIAVSTTPRQKSRYSARNLLIYSIILLALALMAGTWRFLQIIPVLFAPLAHEYLIQAGNRKEWKGKPLLSPPERGVRLLTVLPDSPAHAQGLDSGWIILNVNGVDVNSRRDLTFALNLLPGLAELEVISPQGERTTINIHQRQGKLGLIPVPDPSEQGAFLKLMDRGFLARQLEKIRNKKSGV